MPAPAPAAPGGGSSLRLFTRKEVASHSTRSSVYVTLRGRLVYDVTSFTDEHPGGGEVILEYAGKDITEIMADEDSHIHTESAYEMLQDCLIGYLATPEEEKLLMKDGEIVDTKVPFEMTGLSNAEDLSVKTDFGIDYDKHKFLDLTKPLLLQVLFAKFDKEFYVDQVHRPRHYGHGSAPLFGNFLEPLSLTPWWVIPSLWLPCVAYGTYTACTGLHPVIVTGLFGLGVFIWTFVEYLLHRFLFHLDDNLPNHSLAFTLHFLLHGVHHYLPMDRYRLVMPPALFLVLATPFYRLAMFLFPYYIGLSIFCGGIFGYICYDLTHYFLHHARLPPYFSDLKTYHLQHHYQNYELGFGVTSKFWDVMFGTELINPDVPASKQRMKLK